MFYVVSTRTPPIFQLSYHKDFLSCWKFLTSSRWRGSQSNNVFFVATNYTRMKNSPMTLRQTSAAVIVTNVVETILLRCTFRRNKHKPRTQFANSSYVVNAELMNTATKTKSLLSSNPAGTAPTRMRVCVVRVAGIRRLRVGLRRRKATKRSDEKQLN